MFEKCVSSNHETHQFQDAVFSTFAEIDFIHYETVCFNGLSEPLFSNMADDALHNCTRTALQNLRVNVCKCTQQQELWFQNSFKHQAPSVLKKLPIPQGRYFLVEMAANHDL